jgi:hypothetical protein
MRVRHSSRLDCKSVCVYARAPLVKTWLQERLFASLCVCACATRQDLSARASVCLCVWMRLRFLTRLECKSLCLDVHVPLVKVCLQAPLCVCVQHYPARGLHATTSSQHEPASACSWFCVCYARTWDCKSLHEKKSMSATRERLLFVNVNCRLLFVKRAPAQHELLGRMVWIGAPFHLSWCWRSSCSFWGLKMNEHEHEL